MERNKAQSILNNGFIHTVKDPLWQNIPMTKEINYSYGKSTSLKTNCESEIDSIIETCTSKTYNDSNSLRFLEIDADTLKKKIRKTFGKNVSLDETMTIGKVKHLILS